MAGLYIHVPFCLRKCPYCGFASEPETSGKRQAFLAALGQEMEDWSKEWGDSRFSTVYFGGGTPSLLAPGELSATLTETRNCFRFEESVEMTLEVNPGTSRQDSFNEYKKLGITRLSLGIQAFQDHLLQGIGRIHTVKEAVQAFEQARAAGFNNLSIDLMFALPGQNLGEWEESLSRTVDLQPEHISLYSLTVEEGTPLAGEVESGRLLLPDEELDAQMYQAAYVTLGRAGYEHYEISNFARPGFRSRHNSGYWSGAPYLGLGPAAHSYKDGKRWANAPSLNVYLNEVAAKGKAIALEEDLGVDQKRLERIFLGMRQREGVNLEAFARDFGEHLEKRMGDKLTIFLGKGWLIREQESLRLSEEGMALADEILAEIG
jgi:putative oxygen-independent coproporphyrinogen III oxidase